VIEMTGMSILRMTESFKACVGNGSIRYNVAIPTEIALCLTPPFYVVNVNNRLISTKL